MFFFFFGKANDSKKPYNNGANRNYDMDESPSMNQVSVAIYIFVCTHYQHKINKTTARNKLIPSSLSNSIKMLHRTANNRIISNHHLNKISI